MSCDRRSAPDRPNLHLEPRFSLVDFRADLERYIPRRWRQRRQRAVKKNRAVMIVFLSQAQREMFLLHHLRRDRRLDSTCKKDRLWIAAPEGLEHLVPLQEVVV